MRTPILATLFGFSLVACAGQIDGGPGPGDDDTPPNCGNGVMDPGETCDDGNTASGDGCSSTCQTEAQPRLDVTVGSPTLNTELGTSNMITVTLTGSDGFAGQVTLAPTIVDANNMPLAGWVVNTPAPVTLAENGTQDVVLTVAVPSENKGLAATVKVAATSAATVGTHEADVAVTAVNQVSFTINSNGGQCDYTTKGTTTKVSEGTKIRFVDGGAIDMIIHVQNGGTYGVNHQDTGTTIKTGQAYEQTVKAGSADGGSFFWYCHAPGPDLGDPGQGGMDPAILVTAP